MEVNNDLFDLTGKNAIVTGGSRGLGEFYTLALMMHGANVLVVTSSERGWSKISEKCNKYKGEIHFLKQDLIESNASENIVSKAIEKLGSIDILVNNAGIQIRNDIFNYKKDDWNSVININLNATYFLSHEVSKYMAKQNSGKIINIGSMQSYRAGKNIFPYTTSKHGVIGITKAYADALAPYNIQVNALSPGYIKTDMTKSLEEDPIRGPEIKEHIPSGNWGYPSNLMGPLIFLASSASDYITGVSIPVDGGYLLR